MCEDERACVRMRDVRMKGFRMRVVCEGEGGVMMEM